jgi:hypothetical protein
MKKNYFLKNTFLKKNLTSNFIIIFFCIIQNNLFSQTYNFTTYNNSNSGIGFNSVSDIKIDNNGSLWLSSWYNNGGNGVTKFDGTNWTNYNTSNSGIVDNKIVDIEVDNLNRKWFGSWQNGISKLDGTNWTNFTTSNSSIPSNSINCIATDANNNLWIATNQGITKFDGITWITYNTSNSGISTNSINSVMVDDLNNIWLNSSNKLIKFDGLIWSIYTDNQSHFFRSILKIKNNIVYLNGGNGLIKFDNNLFNHLSWFNNSFCLIDCQIEDIDFDNQNNLWIGYFQECSNAGLQNFTSCTNFFSTNSGLPENDIFSLKIDSLNNIWIGTSSSGLVKMSLNNLGLEEVSFVKKLLIYPNPTKNIFTVNNIENAFSNFEYRIFDLTGRIIKNGESKFNEQINIENLTSGNYIIQIETEDRKITTEKLIKN